MAARPRSPASQDIPHLDLPWRFADVHDDTALDGMLQGVRVLVNAAGPFEQTALPLMRACIRNGCHYIDISNEFDTFQTAWQLEEEARQAQINMIPGAGFGTAAIEALAMHVAARIHEPTRLTVVRSSGGGTRSAGVRRTTERMLAEHPVCSTNGSFTPTVERIQTWELPGGRKACVPVSTGDLFSASLSTGIPNVSTFFTTNMPPLLAKMAVPMFRRLLRARGGRQSVKPQESRKKNGPNAPKPYSQVWIQAQNDRGELATSYITAGKGSKITAAIATEVALRTASLTPWGVHTSGSVVTAAHVLDMPGLRLTDL